jgi:hypothetical protein
VDGKLTKVRPQHDLVVAFITVRHASAGQLAVRITSGNHLEWLHDVEIEDPANNEVLAYESATGLWKNVAPAAGGGASVTISDTAPASPTAGNVWYNSTDGNSYIYYDSFWVDLNPGISGPPGVVAQASAPSSTSVLWLDTDEVPDVPVPAGGTTGQLLAKIDGTDYNTEWVDNESSTFAIQLNEQVISVNYSMPVGYNGVSAGPITIADGIVVTIPAGSSWSVV